MVMVEHGGRRLLYTGDFNDRETLLQPCMEEKLPAHDIMVMESTYYGSRHPPRRDVEDAFIESVKTTLDQGGSVIVPCFAIGRTQEMLLLLERYGIPRYLDGMGKDVTRKLLKNPEFIRDPMALKRAFANTKVVKSKRRQKVLQQPSVVVCTAGMLNGGPVLHYLDEIYNNPRSKVLLTGYQVEETNGRMALETGRLELDRGIVNLQCELEQFDFSAHADETGLEQLITRSMDAGCEDIVFMHGDRCQDMAQEMGERFGIYTHAPVNGDELSL
jgi:putative mRNA 3-end processing factor